MPARFDFYFLLVFNAPHYFVCLCLLIFKTTLILQKTNCAEFNNYQTIFSLFTMLCRFLDLLNGICQLTLMLIFKVFNLLNLNILSTCLNHLFLCPGLFIVYKICPSQLTNPSHSGFTCLILFFKILVSCLSISYII